MVNNIQKWMAKADDSHARIDAKNIEPARTRRRNPFRGVVSRLSSFFCFVGLSSLLPMSGYGLSAADAKAEWMRLHDKASISLTNTIVVAGNTIHTADLLDGGIFKQYVCPGVFLVLDFARTSIWTLQLSGNNEIGFISASRSLAIELMPGSFTHVVAPAPYNSKGTPNRVYGIRTGCGLLIHGCGTLSVSHHGKESFLSQGSGISVGNEHGWNGDLLVTDGASVRVQTWGSPAIYADDGQAVSFVGALLETTGGAVIAEGDVFFDRAAVNLLSPGSGVVAWGNLTMDRSFCASIVQKGNALNTRKILNLDNSIVYAMSRDASCVQMTSDGESAIIGKGVYKFATLGGSDKAALEFDRPLTLDGGELTTCAPDGCGIKSPLKTLTVNSGLIRNQYSMHIKDEFFVSRELIDAYDFVAGWEALGCETSFNPYNAIELFLGYTMLDWIEAQDIETPRGEAYASVSVSSVRLNGGTILSEGAQNGVCLGYQGKVNLSGGSLSGPVKRKPPSGSPYECFPNDANGVSLVCVTNIVAGKPYSRVAGGWTTKLPSGYDTSSLYLDGENKLYFWVPQHYTAGASYTVKFDMNGGTGSKTFTVVEGEVLGGYISQLSPKKDGYRFDGWWTAKSGGQQVAADTVVTGNATYYAHWVVSRVASYAITFNANGGTGGKKFPDVGDGRTLGYYMKQLTPKCEGYSFAGWWTAKTGGTRVDADTVVTGNAMYYAHWTAKIFFHANGGVGGKTFAAAKGEKLGDYMKKVSPAHSGCTFTGWWTARTGGTWVSPSTIVAGSKTYYAQWTDLTFRNSGNACWSQQYDGIWKSGAIVNSQSSSLMATTYGAGVVTFKWKVSSEKNYDKLTFSLDSDLRKAEISGTDDTSWARVSFAVEGDCWHTLQWRYSKDVSVDAGSDCGWVRDIAWIRAGTACAISFNANGGTGGKTFSAVGAGRTFGYYMKQLAPKRDGYAFNGWWTAKTGGTQVTADDIVTGSETYYAHWKVQTYSLFFHANGGTGGKTFASVPAGAKLGTYMDKLTPKNENDRCIFSGWWTKKTGGTQVTATMVAMGNATYYAHWVTSWSRIIKVSSHRIT